MNRILVTCVGVGILLSACATTDMSWQPVVDMKGVSQTKYQHDLEDCRLLAANAPGTDAAKAGKKAGLATGLLTGAGIAVVTVATGGLALLPAMAASTAMAAGGVAASSGVASSQTAKIKYQGIVANCLANRGYKVVGG